MDTKQRGMKVKTIKKLLRNKLEDWMSTIEDDLVRRAVQKDVIVTGGSITSMLMGDTINDYDVYFQTKETTKLVAEYYVGVFNNNIKASRTVDVIPVVKEESIVNCKGIREDRVVIYIKSAGVLDEKTEDYKYFEMYSEEETEEFADSLLNTLEEKKEYRPVFLSQNAITLSDKMQIVIRFFGSPEEIHSNYDFVHSMCYYSYSTNILVTPEKALLAMMSKTLQYEGSLYPIASIFRMKKFIERGWKIGAGQQLKIMWQINELNLKDRAQLYEQLTGVDQAYMIQLIRALKDVDSDKINSTYVAEIIDRIFG